MSQIELIYPIKNNKKNNIESSLAQVNICNVYFDDKEKILEKGTDNHVIIFVGLKILGNFIKFSWLGYKLFNL